MSEVTDYDVIVAMDKSGGGFAKALAGAARRADSHNLDRIKRAFPDYWEQYTLLAGLEKEFSR